SPSRGSTASDETSPPNGPVSCHVRVVCAGVVTVLTKRSRKGMISESGESFLNDLTEHLLSKRIMCANIADLPKRISDSGINKLVINRRPKGFSPHQTRLPVEDHRSNSGSHFNADTPGNHPVIFWPGREPRETWRDLIRLMALTVCPLLEI